jgi:hypothetical protein
VLSLVTFFARAKKVTQGAGAERTQLSNSYIHHTLGNPHTILLPDPQRGVSRALDLDRQLMFAGIHRLAPSACREHMILNMNLEAAE